MNRIASTTNKIITLPKRISKRFFMWFLVSANTPMNKIKSREIVADYLSEGFDIVFSALFVAVLLRATFVQAYYIPSGSMLETLQIKDHLIANRAAYWFYPIKRGDIIIFKYPYDNRDFIKRVIGLPGDKIEITDGQLYRNGKKINEPYLREEMYFDFSPVIVPKNKLFVCGDNRNNSDDSRHWGMLPIENVKAKALLIYWPPSRIRMIKHFRYPEEVR